MPKGSSERKEVILYKDDGSIFARIDEHGYVQYEVCRTVDPSSETQGGQDQVESALPSMGGAVVDRTFLRWLDDALLAKAEEGGNFALDNLFSSRLLTRRVVARIASVISRAGIPASPSISGVPHGGLIWASMAAYHTGRSLIPSSCEFGISVLGECRSLILIEDVMTTGAKAQRALDTVPSGVTVTIIPILLRGDASAIRTPARVFPLYEDIPA